MIEQRSDLAGESALQRTDGAARGRRRRCIDQVDDRFGLGQIELAIEEGAAGELSGFGQTGAEIKASGQQHLQDDHPAVPLQLKDVLAGE